MKRLFYFCAAVCVLLCSCSKSASFVLEIPELTQGTVLVVSTNPEQIESGAMDTLAFAEFERAQIVERTQSGKAIARQQEGFREGRPAKEVPNLAKYVNKVQDGILSVAQVCAELNISRSTWYRLQKRAL